MIDIEGESSSAQALEMGMEVDRRKKKRGEPFFAVKSLETGVIDVSRLCFHVESQPALKADGIGMNMLS